MPLLGRLAHGVPHGEVLGDDWELMCRRDARRVLGVWLVLAVFAAGPAAAVERSPEAVRGRVAVTGSARVIVRLSAETLPEGRLASPEAVAVQRRSIATRRSALLAELARARHRVVREFETIPFVALEVGSEALSVLETSPHAAGVEEDRAEGASLAESVPLIGGVEAWSAGFNGTGVAVAILDTGIDAAHPFFAGRLVEEACYSSSGHCPNGLTSQVGPGAAAPCAYAPAMCGHGTHVAGIAAGFGPTFSGVASLSQIIAVQVFSRLTGNACSGSGHDPCALTFVSDQIAGLERVLALRDRYVIAAVNLSVGAGRFGAPCDGTEAARKAIIDTLRSVGIATIAAAGNDGFTNALNAPACISTVVSVGSTTKADGISTFSNSAPFLSLLAPGSSINSSVPGGGFAAFGGTSQAVPHVTGAWALLKQGRPAATVDETLAALTGAGVPITDPRNGLTKIRIRVSAAIDAIASAPGPTGAPRIVGAKTLAGVGGAPQRTFLATEPIAFEATYLDTLVACAGASPRFVHLFILSAEGALIRQDVAASSPLPPGSKGRALFGELAAGVIDPGEYKFGFLLRDCTDTKSVVTPHLTTFRVVAP